MSLAANLIKFARPALNFVHADVWRIEKTGELFSGIAETEPPLILDTDIGSDGREKTMLHVDRPAPALDRAMIISGKGCRWKVVSFDDNPVNHSVKFEILKIVDGKDA